MPLPFLAQMAIAVAPQIVGGVMNSGQQQQQGGLPGFPQMRFGTRTSRVQQGMQTHAQQTGNLGLGQEEGFMQWLRDPIMNAFMR